jgi:hypothetical protein
MIEVHDDEWRTCLSPVQLARFFGGAVDDTVLAPETMARHIREHKILTPLTR